MIIIPIGVTSIPIPFPVVLNSGNYAGDPLAKPTVKLSKNGGAQVDAKGNVIQVPETGGFWFWPAPQDVDTLGPVMMFVTVGPQDFAPWPGYYVQPQSWWEQLMAIPPNISALLANSRLLAKALIPPNEQGLIQ